MKPRSVLVAIVVLVASSALTLGGLVARPTVAAAQTNPYERGPAPTTASIEAATGPFQIATAPVTGQTGFGGGTIYYPTDTSQGTFGGVAVAPGFFAFSWQMAWFGTRVASQGFVVIALDTITPLDLPFMRATELQAALDYLTQQSTVRTRVDPNRLAVAGWSMGGGGTLEQATNNPRLKAAVAFQPWDLIWNFNNVRVPTMIIGAQNDTVAPVATMASPFYNQIPATTEKAFVNVAGQAHFLGSASNTTQAKYTIAWLKRYVDNDTRYDQFLCPRPSGPTIAEYRDTCPTGS